MNSSRRRRLAVILGAAVALHALPAPAAGDTQHAKELYQQGSVYFDTGQFDRAIEVWQRAYEEKQDPSFLYNIAQAYRLAGDTRKAIFFYKSFLRHSPKSDRRDAEEKIAALEQKLATEGPSNQTASPPSPPTQPAQAASTPIPPPTDAVAPAGVAVALTPSSFTDTRGTGTLAPDGSTPTVAAQATDAPLRSRPVDLNVAAGANVWISGVEGSADPSFLVAITGGYTFGAEGTTRARFRLGVVLAFTSFNDTGSRDSFFAALVDPTIRIRILSERLYVSADVGVGLLTAGGLRPTSALLVQNQTLEITGTQSLVEVRPGLGVEYRLRPGLAVVAAPAMAYTPKPTYFNGPLARFELLVGLGLRI